MTQVINSLSGWDFEDLIRETVKDLNDDYTKYTDPNNVITDRLVRFLKRLPNANINAEIKKLVE